MHRIAYTDAVPDVPQWLSAEAKDFLAGCLTRKASDRCTAAQLLEHPFLASAAVLDRKIEDAKNKWVSPKSTLDAALWESESDNDEADDELPSHSTAERIKALACPASAVPDWDSDEGWIDVLSAPTEASDVVAVPAEETTDLKGATTSEDQAADCGVLHVTMDSSVLNVVVEANYDSELQFSHHSLGVWVCYETVPPCKLSCNNTSMNAIDFVPAQNTLLSYTLLFLFANLSAPTWLLLCWPPSRHVQ
jgi:serine/threonine protein kinase